jgi:hypothetical protein
MAGLESLDDVRAALLDTEAIHHKLKPFLLRPEAPEARAIDPQALEEALRTASPSVYIDESRRKLVAFAARTVGELDQPRENGGARLEGVGHGRVVIGQRGVGKTFFLKSLAAALQKAVCRTYICWINYKTAMARGPIKPPFGLFADLLGQDNGVPGRIDALSAWLEKRDQRVLFMLDEFEAVFTLRDGAGEATIAEVLFDRHAARSAHHHGHPDGQLGEASPPVLRGAPPG